MEQKLYEALSNLVRAWECGDGEDVAEAIKVAKSVIADAGRKNSINMIAAPIIESYRTMARG